jgi:hypothetical protein
LVAAINKDMLQKILCDKVPPSGLKHLLAAALR